MSTFEVTVVPPSSVVPPPIRTQRALPTPTVSDRLAEWRERGEEFVRERPMAALVIAATAGLLAGRLFRTLMRSRDATPDEAPLRDQNALRR